MATAARTDWTDIPAAAKEMAGNWQQFDYFCWFRSRELDAPGDWCIVYSSGRDAGLLAQSNHAEISKRLAPFMEGDDPPVVPEVHGHWAVGHVEGFSIRVYEPDGSITPAFEEWCRIQEELDNYPALSEEDWSERQYQATLDNYRSELWREKNLPEGWEAEAYSYFSDNCMDEFIEDRDDQGGWAPREKLVEALQALGLWPTVIVEN